MRNQVDNFKDLKTFDTMRVEYLSSLIIGVHDSANETGSQTSDWKTCDAIIQNPRVKTKNSEFYCLSKDEMDSVKIFVSSSESIMITLKILKS